MKISARNILSGTVSAVLPGSVNDEVHLITQGGDEIVAVVTHGSTESLGLAVGAEALALIKASSVLILTERGMKLSARNRLRGTVARVTNGLVSAEVSIRLSGGEEIHATITHEASTELGLNPGIDATAVFKASSVILAVAG
ncbi:molybdenum-pterin binding protein [Burkholderiales bacterium GJ-E10]|nr:molybdenum-pterin binding protein [Burkholderiales bacterium GJ-E10]